MNQLPELFSGVFGLVLFVIFLALAIYWLLFPMMVCSRLDKIAKAVAALEKTTSDQSLVQRNFFADAREKMSNEQPRQTI